MKTIFLSILLAVCSLSLQAQSKTQTIVIKTSMYCDHCKACGSCGGRLEKVVYDIKGVKRLDISEGDSTLKIVYNTEKTTAEDIRLAISKAGYDADDVKADPQAYAALDECCKKPE